MSIPTGTLQPSTFVYANNNPVANGYLLMSLYPAGGQENSSIQLQGNKVKVLLNSSGTIINNSFPDATYVFNVYNAFGQLVGGPVIATVGGSDIIL
jgi:hypothetical protein